jgi:hypothetical protein
VLCDEEHPFCRVPGSWSSLEEDRLVELVREVHSHAMSTGMLFEIGFCCGVGDHKGKELAEFLPQVSQRTEEAADMTAGELRFALANECLYCVPVLDSTEDVHLYHGPIWQAQGFSAQSLQDLDAVIPLEKSWQSSVSGIFQSVTDSVGNPTDLLFE